MIVAAQGSLLFLASILGLALLVLFHEAGHFFVARAVGMRPRKFYIGFPPAVAKVTRGGIEYGIGAIPLGGYVKIPGMHRPGASDLDGYFAPAREEAPELVPRLEAAKRAVESRDAGEAMAALPALRAALEQAQLSRMAQRSAERGLLEAEEGLGSDAYWRQPAWKKISVIFAGPATNLVLAVLLFAILFMINTSRGTQIVDAVDKGKPADKAGIQAGDRIVAINGHAVQPDDIGRTIGGSQGRPLRITVVRRGERLTLRPVRARPVAGTYRIGIGLRAELGPGESAPAAFADSLSLTRDVTGEIAGSLLRLSKGQGKDEISGPVGIVRGSTDALRHGFKNFLWVQGLISLSLALLNLLPLLPLDGGHIAFSIAEAIRGRAIPRHVFERLSAVGIALVLLLFFTGLSNDLGG